VGVFNSSIEGVWRLAAKVVFSVCRSFRMRGLRIALRVVVLRVSFRPEAWLLDDMGHLAGDHFGR
jgi:hypothetical protein